MNKIRLKIGDIIEIPLPNGKKAYAQYVFRDNWGDVIRVYDLIIDYDDEVNIATLSTNKYLFPPIFTRIKHGMNVSTQLKSLDLIRKAGVGISPAFEKMAQEGRNYDWRVLGNLKVEDLDILTLYGFGVGIFGALKKDGFCMTERKTLKLGKYCLKS